LELENVESIPLEKLLFVGGKLENGKEESNLRTPIRIESSIRSNPPLKVDTNPRA